MIKYLDEKYQMGGKSYLTYNAELQSIILGKLRQELKQVVTSTGRTKENKHILACFFSVCFLHFYLVQARLGNIVTSGGLGQLIIKSVSHSYFHRLT